MRTHRHILTLLALVAAIGQQTQKKSTSEAQKKSTSEIHHATRPYVMPPLLPESTVPAYESAEHKYAQHKFDQATKEHIERLAQIEALREKVRQIDGQISPDINTRVDRLRINDRIKDLISFDESTKDDMKKLRDQLEVVDSCALIYRTTIDKRSADITTRESELIMACKMLELYPPETGNH